MSDLLLGLLNHVQDDEHMSKMIRAYIVNPDSSTLVRESDAFIDQSPGGTPDENTETHD